MIKHVCFSSKLDQEALEIILQEFCQLLLEKMKLLHGIAVIFTLEVREAAHHTLIYNLN